MGAAWIEPSASGQNARDLGERGGQAEKSRESGRQQGGVGADRVGGFDPTPVRHGPNQPEQETPMLQHQGKKLGIELTQNPPGVSRPPLIDCVRAASTA